MNIHDILADMASRPVQAADAVIDGISLETLHAMPEGRGNSIAWLIWHSGRQMDVQLAGLTGTEQVWQLGRWAERLGIDASPTDFGLGHNAQEVAAIRVDDAGALRDYLAAVVEAVKQYTRQLSETDLDDVVDDSWDPPTTRGVRIVSMIDDAAVHVGQAAYVRGLIERWSIGV